MLAFRPIALLFALLVLVSCAYSPDNSVLSGNRCAKGSAEILQDVDWQEATKLNLRIRQGDFVPVFMGLLQNKAYVLTIENADDSGHTFRAMEFFRAVAVAGVRVDGGEFKQVSCLNGVSIPPGKITEVRLVAIRDGSYEFDDNSLMFSLAMIGSAGGFITIEPPRVLTVSPLDHLKLFERKPIELIPEETKPTGLFDDQQEESAPEPGGLFDDQEQSPDEPPSGLFDDPAPEQPIDPSPSVPVETVPDPVAQPEADPTESLFSDPSLEPLPEKPEAPLVDVSPETAPETPPETMAPKPLDSETDMMMEEAPVVDAPPQAPVDIESDMMMEEAPVVDSAPEASFEDEEFFVEEELLIKGSEKTQEESTPAQPMAPVALPENNEVLDGPPADIFSDPPDVVNSGPDSGGAAGDDQFDGSG